MTNIDPQFKQQINNDQARLNTKLEAFSSLFKEAQDFVDSRTDNGLRQLLSNPDIMGRRKDVPVKQKEINDELRKLRNFAKLDAKDILHIDRNAKSKTGIDAADLKKSEKGMHEFLSAYFFLRSCNIGQNIHSMRMRKTLPQETSKEWHNVIDGANLSRALYSLERMISNNEKNWYYSNIDDVVKDIHRLLAK